MKEFWQYIYILFLKGKKTKKILFVDRIFKNSLKPVFKSSL